MSFSIPHLFTPGTKAVAEEVNSNFAACKYAIIDNQDNVATNTADITSLQADKAEKNGSVTENFEIADATTNNHAVNKQQFDAYQTNLESTLYKDLYVPYAVSSGKQDANGFASFIQKDSDSQITILAGSSNPDLVMCYPDGEIEQVASDTVISSGLTADNTYFIIKEKGSSISVITTNITEDAKQPSAPNTGDYWLNIGVKPYKPYKYDGSVWVETQFVKLGEATKASGTLATPISYAFNGMYTSLDTTLSAKATKITFNHNIGSRSLEACLLYLRCTSPVSVFSINDVIAPYQNSAGGGGFTGPFTPTIDSKNTISYITGSITGYFVNLASATHSPSSAYWKQFVIAKRSF